MPRIFISYRRSDSQMVAGRLRESLARHLGDDVIFRDKDSIGAGEDWTQAIENCLSGNVIVLSLIGPAWATALDESGARRLDNPDDWNRIELEIALKRSVRIIPLLIDETSMPQEVDLPKSLCQLTHINALKLRDDDWDSDVEKLINALGLQRKWSYIRRPVAWAMVVVIVSAIGVAGYWWSRSPNERTTSNLSSKTMEAGRQSASGGAYLADIKQKLRAEQEKGLSLLFSSNPTDQAAAISLIDSNLGNIEKALRSFPNDVYLHSLAGYAAKNVYASSGGSDLLQPEQRKKYLDQAKMHFETALSINPKDPGAVNGMGNVLFYMQKLDDAIRYHERAIQLNGGSYPAAEHDLNLVKGVKNGTIPFPK